MVCKKKGCINDLENLNFQSQKYESCCLYVQTKTTLYLKSIKYFLERGFGLVFQLSIHYYCNDEKKEII